MRCSACQHQSPPNAKFCTQCGAALKPGCNNCGVELAPQAKFCHECGTPTAESGRPSEPTSARKIVSILFADLVGSTGLHERLDPESTRRFMESYYDVARQAVTLHGGKVTQFLGDGVKAVFGVPRVAEDDAIRAVRAAAAMQQGFRKLAEQQAEAVGSTGLRVAVNTGEVIAEGETEIIGDPVNVAARLQEHGKDGDVVIGESTEHLVANQITLELLGAFGLKGRSGNVKAYKLLSLEPPQRKVAAFVGREKELARLSAVYDQALAGPSTKMAVLLGSAGLGKSRLIGEFARRSATVFSSNASVIQAHCDAAKGATFSPLADAFRKHLALAADASTEIIQEAVDKVLAADDHQKRIASGIVGLLIGQAASPEETFFVIRRFLTAMSREQPVVLIIDDLHWAEPLLFDLLEHLVQWGQELPLFLLIGARPELREARSSFTSTGGYVGDLITLEGLDANASMKLAAGVIGAGDLPAAVAAKVLATTEGNPLFISELIRMLVVEGALIHEDGEWRTGESLATVQMPPTIHALLASRIERLKPLDCAILERAAVVGRQFSRNAVTALLPNDPDEIDARLEALQGFELIERGTGWYIGDPVLRFHHVLIRDAAYRRLLKGSRAELHANLANWIEQRVGESHEHDELIGRHLEDAHRLLGELGPLDVAGEELGERAAARLSAAGRRALEADDVPLAATILGRALQRMRPDHAERADLCIDWSEALLAEGEVTTAEQGIEELGRLMQDSPRLTAWQHCLKGHHTVLTAPRELSATVASVAKAAETLAGLEDSAGEAKAHFVHAIALSRQGQIGACEAALDQALAAARKAQDRRQANTVLAIAPVAALWGPSPVTRASGRCLDVVRVLRITQGAPAVEAVALMCQGVLEALRGRSDAAHRMIESGREMVEELGIAPQLRNADAFAGYVHLLENKLPEAETKLRRAYQGLRELGLGIDAARAAAMLAQVLLTKGEIEEAKTLSHESEELAGDDLKAAIAWRGVRAEALARGGEHNDAIKLAQKAVRIAEKTDALLDHADARQALAVALRAAGQTQEANAEEQRARKLWEDKGATLLLGQQKPEERGGKSKVPQGNPDIPPVSAPTITTHAPRSVIPNVATAAIAQLEKLTTVRDFKALRELFCDDCQEIDHVNGATYGADACVKGIERVMRAQEPYYRHDPLATLGPSLYLARRYAGGVASAGGRYDVGAFEVVILHLFEVDKQGMFRRSEAFAENKLGDAIVRLYERYAESLPDGPGRHRQLAIAGFLKTANGPLDFEGFAAGLAPKLQAVDHRTVGFGTLSSGESVANATNVLVNELSKGVIFGYADVAALTPDATLFLSTSTGTDHSSGGKWERAVWELLFFDGAGLVKHWERFEEDNGDEALARIHELTDGTADNAVIEEQQRFTHRLRPGVVPNAGSNAGVTWVKALANNDLELLRQLLPESYVEYDHSSGTRWGREGTVESVQRLLNSSEPFFHWEDIATLGPNLSLSRNQYGASGAESKNFDVGAYEKVRYQVAYLGDAGVIECEAFDDTKLGDAIARLYERYAESLPEGAERETAVALSAFIKFGLVWDLEGIATLLAPDIQYVDHRHAGVGKLDNRDAVINVGRVMKEELTNNLQVSLEEVLRLLPNALLFYYIDNGTDKRSGGDFERHIWDVAVFNDDGLVSHWERFEHEHKDQALARFEELTGCSATQPTHAEKKPDVITGLLPQGLERLARGRHQEPVVFDLPAACNARDWDAALACFSDDYIQVSHSTGSTMDRDEVLKGVKSLFRVPDAEFHNGPLIRLGERMYLLWRYTRATGTGSQRFDVGEYDLLMYHVCELDEQGRCWRDETFSESRLGDAVSRLYQRYAESLPDGPDQAKAQGLANILQAGSGPIDPERLKPHWSENVQLVDHRTAGMGTIEGADAVTEAISVMVVELTEDFTGQFDDVVSLRADALLAHYTTGGKGQLSGGDFEQLAWYLMTADEQGKITRWEIFEEEQLEQAGARFEELMGDGATTQKTAPARRITPNAATDALARFEALAAARDWTTARALFSDQHAEIDHTTGATFGPDECVAGAERLYRSTDPHLHQAPIATLGDSLCLVERQAGASGSKGQRYDVGPYEHRSLNVTEVDENGLFVHAEIFAENKLGEAIIRLCERYAESLADSVERTRALGIAEMCKAIIGTMDYERFVACLAPDVVQHDYRHVGSGTLSGAEDVAKVTRVTLIELTENITGTIDGLLGLRSEGSLFHFTNTGTLRNSGGEFERNTWELVLHDDAGLVSHWERFDSKDADKAIARFEELTERAKPEPVKRIVQPNIATKGMVKSLEAITAQNWEEVRLGIHDDLVEIDHTTGAKLGPEALLSSLQLLFKGENPQYRYEPIATLGPHLMLGWRTISSSGAKGKRFDVGPYEHTALQLIECDDEQRLRYAEVFAENKLGEAVARLYERYAESLPEGPERERAMATAHTVSLTLTHTTPQPGEDGYTPHITGLENSVVEQEAFAPDVQGIDHRPIVGGIQHGNWFQQMQKVMTELVSDVSFHLNDIFALSSEALLRHTAYRGHLKEGGGEFELDMYLLSVFGPDGRQAQVEAFQAGQEEKALARFEDVTVGAKPEAVRRLWQPNRASAAMRRFAEAVKTQQWPDINDIVSEDYQELHHPTGSSFGREETIESFKRLYRSEGAYYQQEIIATMGERFSLMWGRFGASAGVSRKFDVGPYENIFYVLMEVNEQGKNCRGEVFSENKLGEAIARLYERYAQQLPEGPERDRANTLAHTVALMITTTTKGPVADAFSADNMGIDHRLVGHEQVGNFIQRFLKASKEVYRDTSFQINDVLALNNAGLLRQTSISGYGKESGGFFELDVYLLSIFGPDGLQSALETFEAGQEEKALARFDELTSDTAATPQSVPERRVTPNLATEWMKRWDTAVASQDWTAIRALISDNTIEIDHPNGISYGPDAVVSRIESLWRSDNPWARNDPIVTLGDRLGLFHRHWGASGAQGKRYEVGAYEHGVIMLAEASPDGQHGGNTELFAESKLGEAVARLYERYADLLPAGNEQQHAQQVAASYRALLTPFDMDVMGPRLATDIIFIDNRLLGSWHGTGKDEAVKHIHALNEVADNIQLYDEDVLATEPNLLLVQRMTCGIERVGGGEYERPLLLLMGFDHQGLNNRWEFFDVGDEAKALARFDELTADTTPTLIPQSANPNTPANGLARVLTAMNTQDWAGLRATYSDDYVEIHHPTGSTFGPDESVKSIKANLESENGYHEITQIAALGTRLFLNHMRAGASGKASKRYDIGPYEHRFVSVIQANDQGLNERHEVFAEEKLGDALVRIYELYAESLPEGPERERACRIASGWSTLNGPVDIEHMTNVTAPSCKLVDHRIYGAWTSGNAEEMLQHFLAQLELASDFACRMDEVIELAPDAACLRYTYYGTDRTSGGLFENCFCGVHFFGANEQGPRIEVFEKEDIDKARARFKELTVGAGDVDNIEPSEPQQDKITAYFSNAATNAHASFVKLYMDKDWDSAHLILTEDVRISDRRRLLMVETDGRDKYLDYFRALGDLPNTKVTPRLLATRGERLTLSYDTLVVSGDDVGESEVHILDLFCLNENGEIDQIIRYSPEDIDEAYAELDERFLNEQVAAYPAHTASVLNWKSAFEAHDWDALTQIYSDDLIATDHRLVGWGEFRGPAGLVEAHRTYVALAPDLQMRIEHLRFNERGVLAQGLWYGTRDGGAFENMQYAVGELNGEGRICRWDIYDERKLAQALIRFEELTGESPQLPSPEAREDRIASHFTNAAAKAGQTYADLFMKRDWDGIKQLFSPDRHVLDHQPHVQLELNRDEYITFARQLGEMRSTQLTLTLLATRGERLCLARAVLVVSDDDVGSSEIETLNVVELDENGTIATMIRFSPEAIDEAYAELDRRYFAGEAKEHKANQQLFREAIARRDWEAVQALAAPEFVEEDHRSLAVLGTRHGPQSWAETSTALVELAPDTQVRMDHIRLGPRCSLNHATFHGTQDGGHYEMPFITVALCDADERLIHHDLYEPEQIEIAAEKFKQLSQRLQTHK